MTSTRSCTRKRTRSQMKETETESEKECPICFSTEVDAVFSFRCGHFICGKCDAELYSRADDRCPLCRAPRLSESISRHASSLSPDNGSRRSVALATRSLQEQFGFDPHQSTIFFPSTGAVVFDVLVPAAAHPNRRPRRRQNNNSATIPNQFPSVRLQAAVNASVHALHGLVNPQAVTLAEFLARVSDLRSSA